MSRISEVMTSINNAFDEDEAYRNIPIYWDDMELTPNNPSFPCILFKLREWTPSKGCFDERVLEIRIMSNTLKPRNTILELWEYEELVRDTIDVLMMNTSDFSLTEIGGSEVLELSPNRENRESYKGAKDVFSNLTILYYNLTY